MPLPKALLCALGDHSPATEEAGLRRAGFATAVLHWKDLADKTNDWMQLAAVLDDPAVQAWVLTGEAADFTEDLLCRVALLALALDRPTQPARPWFFTEKVRRPRCRRCWSMSESAAPKTPLQPGSWPRASSRGSL